jgi:hypothetical protein
MRACKANFILLQFGLTCPIDFRFLGAILKTNNSGLPLLPGRQATIPSLPRTITAAVTLWATVSERAQKKTPP